ncbi:MAG: MATE family efflux transporter [Bacteroidaceae bacterium]|nr:MATE family efflux transporter [Bacteroidaceae bacterium]
MSLIVSNIKAISLLGLPIVVGQLGVVLQGMADTIMVGRYGTAELGASALVNNIYNFAIFFLLGISYATTPVIGGAYGRGDNDGVARSLRESLVVNLFFSLLLMALLTILYFRIELLRQPSGLMPLVRPYYLVLMFSLPFLAGFNALKQFVEAVGVTSLPMEAMIAGNVMNIVLNAVFIYGLFGMPELGLLGAGIATLLSRVFLFAVMAAAMLRDHRFSPWLTSCNTTVSCAGCARMTRIGLPISLQLCLESASFNVAGIFMGWTGSVSLAAHQVMCSIATLIFMIHYGVGAAAAIRISHFRGRGEWGAVRDTVRTAWGISALIALLLVSVICIFRHSVTSVFTSDPVVRSVCYSLLPAFVLYQLGDCTQIIFANSLRAIEAVGRMVLYALVAYVFVSIPMSYFLGIFLGYGAQGIWYGIPFGLSVAAMLFIYEFKRNTICK